MEFRAIVLLTVTAFALVGSTRGRIMPNPCPDYADVYCSCNFPKEAELVRLNMCLSIMSSRRSCEPCGTDMQEHFECNTCPGNLCPICSATDPSFKGNHTAPKDLWWFTFSPRDGRIIYLPQMMTPHGNSQIPVTSYLWKIGNSSNPGEDSYQTDLTSDSEKQMGSIAENRKISELEESSKHEDFNSRTSTLKTEGLGSRHRVNRLPGSKVKDSFRLEAGSEAPPESLFEKDFDPQNCYFIPLRTHSAVHMDSRTAFDLQPTKESYDPNRVKNSSSSLNTELHVFGTRIVVVCPMRKFWNIFSPESDYASAINKRAVDAKTECSANRVGNETISDSGAMYDFKCFVPPGEIFESAKSDKSIFVTDDSKKYDANFFQTDVVALLQDMSSCVEDDRDLIVFDREAEIDFSNCDFASLPELIQKNVVKAIKILKIKGSSSKLEFKMLKHLANNANLYIAMTMEFPEGNFDSKVWENTFVEDFQSDVAVDGVLKLKIVLYARSKPFAIWPMKKENFYFGTRDEQRYSFPKPGRIVMYSQLPNQNRIEISDHLFEGVDFTKRERNVEDKSCSVSCRLCEVMSISPFDDHQSYKIPDTEPSEREHPRITCRQLNNLNNRFGCDCSKLPETEHLRTESDAVFNSLYFPLVTPKSPQLRVKFRKWNEGNIPGTFEIYDHFEDDVGRKMVNTLEKFPEKDAVKDGMEVQVSYVGLHVGEDAMDKDLEKDQTGEEGGSHVADNTGSRIMYTFMKFPKNLPVSAKNAENNFFQRDDSENFFEGMDFKYIDVDPTANNSVLKAMIDNAMNNYLRTVGDMMSKFADEDTGEDESGNEDYMGSLGSYVDLHMEQDTTSKDSEKIEDGGGMRNQDLNIDSDNADERMNWELNGYVKRDDTEEDDGINQGGTEDAYLLTKERENMMDQKWNRLEEIRNRIVEDYLRSLGKNAGIENKDELGNAMRQEFNNNPAIEVISTNETEEDTDIAGTGMYGARLRFKRQLLQSAENKEDEENSISITVRDSPRQRRRAFDKLPENSWCTLKRMTRRGDLKCLIWKEKKQCTLICQSGCSVRGSPRAHMKCQKGTNRWQPQDLVCECGGRRPHPGRPKQPQHPHPRPHPPKHPKDNDDYDYDPKKEHDDDFENSGKDSDDDRPYGQEEYVP